MNMNMKLNLTRVLSLAGLFLTTAATTQANDIVDFLRAVNGQSGRRGAPVVQPVGGHDHGHGGYANSNQSHVGHGHGSPVSSQGFHRSQMNTVGLRPGPAVAPRPRSGVQINLQFASNAGRNQGYGVPAYPVMQPQMQAIPPVPIYPPMQAYPEVAPSPFALGQFVNCHVPLSTCVRVEDERNIAPNAVPVIIAVRDPNMCVHDVQERLVYVQVFVPPCPLRDVKVSPCHTRISLDYGKYEVDIKSGNGMIVIDYDD